MNLKIAYFTIKNPLIAKRLVDRLITKPDDTVLLPFSDHPGPISSEILSRDFKSLTVCERDSHLAHEFESHVKRFFPERRINIFNCDLFDLSYDLHQESAQKRCADIVRTTLDYNDKNYRRIKYLVPLMRSKNESSFFRNMYYQASLRIGLCAETMIDYYLLVSGRQLRYLHAKPSENLNHYRHITILYNILFDAHKLDTIDLRDSFDIGLKDIQKISSNRDPSYQSVHLLLMQPRAGIIDELGPKALLEFRFFITQIMSKRTGLVSSFLGRWFGDCSHDLLHIGATNTTRVGDLDKDQYLELFKRLRIKNNYRESTFAMAALKAESFYQGITAKQTSHS